MVHSRKPNPQLLHAAAGGRPLDVDPAVRVRAAPPAAVPAPGAVPAVSPARVVRLAVVPRVLGDAVAVEPGEHGGEEEEDAVHDAEREAGLEHGARLVGVDRDAVAVEGPEYPEADVVARPADVGAVGAGDETEVVDCCDEGADESCGENMYVSGIAHRCSGGRSPVCVSYRDQLRRQRAHWSCSCGRRRA